MTNTVVVIGANFGDEGKGLITDFETRRLGAQLVARFNGGAQAGHTVTTDSGLRHVFGHTSSGTFAGADTYLSSNFLVNPLVLEKELTALRALSVRPTVYSHPDARVSTIYDMVLNAMIETKRGAQRHGSCGLGINETVTRYGAGYGFNMSIFSQPVDHIADVFEMIHREYLPRRLEELELSLDDCSDAMLPLITVLKDTNFMYHAERLRDSAALLAVTGTIALEDEQPLVLEGAQGLMLDENLGAFPHVTRSITGLPSAIHAAAELTKRVLQPVYVTRCYLTRHGAGPLEHEGEDHGCKVVDKTNVPNQWQGSLRFAPLNLRQLRDFISMDISRGQLTCEMYGSQIVNPTLAVTCLDQIDGAVNLIDLDDTTVKIPAEEAAQFIADRVGLPLSHSSHGATASRVHRVVQ